MRTRFSCNGLTEGGRSAGVVEVVFDSGPDATLVERWRMHLGQIMIGSGPELMRLQEFAIVLMNLIGSGDVIVSINRTSSLVVDSIALPARSITNGTNPGESKNQASLFHVQDINRVLFCDEYEIKILVCGENFLLFKLTGLSKVIYFNHFNLDSHDLDLEALEKQSILERLHHISIDIEYKNCATTTFKIKIALQRIDCVKSLHVVYSGDHTVTNNIISITHDSSEVIIPESD
ncbi:hypothetical protein Tco_0487824 [Tanacetum coccineum]